MSMMKQDIYHADVKRYEQHQVIVRGHFLFNDGTMKPFAMNNRLEDGSVREMIAVVVDGEPWKPECPDERYEVTDGVITAIELGDVRYERVTHRERDDAEWMNVE